MSVSSLINELSGVFRFSHHHEQSYGRRIVTRILGSRISLAASSVSWLLFVLSTVNKILNQDAMGACATLRLASAFYCGLVSQAFFVWRRHAIVRALHKLRCIASSLERDAPPETQDDFARVGDMGFRLMRACKVYSVMAASSVLVPVIFTGASVLPIWPVPQSPLEKAAAIVFYTFTCPTLAYSGIYIFFTSLTIGGMITAVQYRAIGTHLESAQNEAEVLRAIRWHQSLNSATFALNASYVDVLLHYLGSVMLISMSSCFLLFSGHIDALGVITCLCHMLLFMPLCAMGQVVQTASEDLGFKTYSGGWLAEGTSARLLRLCVMRRAVRAFDFNVGGIGSLNLPACFYSMKTWFSYLQLLLNMRRG